MRLISNVGDDGQPRDTGDVMAEVDDAFAAMFGPDQARPIAQRLTLENIEAWREEYGSTTLVPPPGVYLQPNNAITNDPCAFCGVRTDPCGYDVQTEARELVCHDCAERLAPGQERVGARLAALEDEFSRLDAAARGAVLVVLAGWFDRAALTLSSGLGPTAQ